MLNRIAWSAERGTRNYLYAATQDTEPGAYISRCKVIQPSKYVLSEKGQKVQKKLFEELKAFWVNEAPETATLLA